MNYAYICEYLLIPVGFCGILLIRAAKMAQSMKIKSLRLEAGLSQNQLSRKADLDRGTISAAENNKDVQDVTVAKIATALSTALRRNIKTEDNL